MKTISLFNEDGERKTQRGSERERERETERKREREKEKERG